VLELPDSSCGAAIMTRSIKGFKVDWGDRWRHSAWAERETAPKHMYWFEVSPDLTVKLLHSSSPVEEDCLKATQAVEEFVEGHKNR
jgi:hypothetical protein